MGFQYAIVYKGDVIANREIKTINQALSYLGVIRNAEFDEFDTVRLSQHRHNPDYLDKCVDLADKLGV